MKLARITLHAAFCMMILVGLTSTVAATGTNKSGSSSNKSSSSSSSTTATTTQSNATGVQPYTSTTALQVGTIVQLSGGNTTDSVEPATTKQMQNMYGTVVDPHILPLTITDSNLANETYVANSGQYDTLVSTQNGAINEGDYVTISAISGVAMKAGTYEQQNYVYGRAAAKFDGKANVIGTTSLKYSDGATQTVQLGIIPVSINVQRNPNQRSTKADLPNFLEVAGQAIAQKPLSPFRIYLGVAITVLCIIIALVTLYAGVRSAIISIGRNPLSKGTILRGLAEVILTSFIILIIGLFAVYLLLKL